jgi:hypothetical protein
MTFLERRTDRRPPLARRVRSAAVILLLVPAVVRADGPKQPTLDQALHARAEDLGRGYLAARSLLKWVESAKRGGAVTTDIDGAEAEIDSSNADVWAEGLKRRLDTYGSAIRKRGFRRLAGEYAMNRGAECLYGIAKRVAVEQDSFLLRLLVRHASDSSMQMVHGGVVVESSVVIEDQMDPDHVIAGWVSGGQIKLRNARGCRMVLARR